jgi:hypothetical protein
MMDATMLGQTILVVVVVVVVGRPSPLQAVQDELVLVMEEQATKDMALLHPRLLLPQRLEEGRVILQEEEGRRGEQVFQAPRHSAGQQRQQRQRSPLCRLLEITVKLEGEPVSWLHRIGLPRSPRGDDAASIILAMIMFDEGEGKLSEGEGKVSVGLGGKGKVSVG